jgi:hypothetical protein
MPGGKGLSAEARQGEGGTTAYPAPQRIRAMTLAYTLVIPGREHSERTRNPEMQAQRVALDSGSGANAPSRNDKVRWLFEN